MTDATAHICREVFDGESLRQDAAVLVADGKVTGICGRSEVPHGYKPENAGEGILSAGFVDLQVNGGGGLMLGDAETLEDIEQICAAHLPLGTTALTPTLITDTAQTTRKVVELAIQAWSARVPGFHGLHLEGPHLFAGRKGAHDADLIRPMTAEDLELYISAARTLPSLMVTIAPETVTENQVRDMSEAGIHVSLGHSGASYRACRQIAEAGANCVTHLFNAMSPLQHREPGLVGAALDLGDLNAGLIADGVHVDPVAIKVALKSKSGPGRLFLVTDAMSQTGTDVTSFTLGGREIFRRNGTLTLADGTLAGADIDMPASVRFLVEQVGLDPQTALKMATSIPADVIGQPLGRLQEDKAADLVLLGKDFSVERVWLAGKALEMPS